MNKPILPLEMDEYEVEENRPLCCRSICCWRFRKFPNDSPDRGANKRDSDVFYRRFSDLQQQGPLGPEETNDEDLMYDEDVFYTDGALMMPDLTQNARENIPMTTGKFTTHSQQGPEENIGTDVDLGDVRENRVAYHAVNNIDEAVQTDLPEEITRGTFCERCQRLHDVIMSDDHEAWYGDDNQNICVLQSITSSATWWTTSESMADCSLSGRDPLQHKLRSTKSESDTRAVQESKQNTALEEIDNHVTKISRMRSDEVGYGYKFCWDNLSDNECSSDGRDSAESSSNLHDFEEGSMEMESPFLDSNESLLSEDVMTGFEFGSGSSSYRDYMENKNNCRADISFHNKDQNWRLERERCRRQDNLLELLAKNDLSDDDNL